MLREEALAFLEGVNGNCSKQGLAAMTSLMEKLHSPDRDLKIIHITGTNGKGSTGEYISCMLQAAGYRVGSFTSPYFNCPEECIRINGKEIEEESLLLYMEQMAPFFSKLPKGEPVPSGFEILTALALQYFKDQKVDFVILEVGLGGRLDATNIIKQSLVSVFTPISIDHIALLGPTLENIAVEKAGIIKKNSLVVTIEQPYEVKQVLEARSKQMGQKLHELLYEEVQHIKVIADKTYFNYKETTYSLQMIGKHQAYNCALAIKVVEVLKQKKLLNIELSQQLQGAANMSWRGRFEKILNVPEVYIDGAHNVAGIKALRETMTALEPMYTIGVIGILKDKQVDEILQIMEQSLDEVIVTMPPHARAMDSKDLLDKVQQYFNKTYRQDSAERSIKTAILQARGRKEKVRIVCFGSLYMLSQIRRGVASFIRQ